MSVEQKDTSGEGHEDEESSHDNLGVTTGGLDLDLDLSSVEDIEVLKKYALDVRSSHNEMCKKMAKTLRKLKAFKSGSGVDGETATDSAGVPLFGYDLQGNQHRYYKDFESESRISLVLQRVIDPVVAENSTNRSFPVSAVVWSQFVSVLRGAALSRELTSTLELEQELTSSSTALIAQVVYDGLASAPIFTDKGTWNSWTGTNVTREVELSDLQGSSVAAPKCARDLVSNLECAGNALAFISGAEANTEGRPIRAFNSIITAMHSGGHLADFDFRFLLEDINALLNLWLGRLRRKIIKTEKVKVDGVEQEVSSVVNVDSGEAIRMLCDMVGAYEPSDNRHSKFLVKLRVKEPKVASKSPKKAHKDSDSSGEESVGSPDGAPPRKKKVKTSKEDAKPNTKRVAPCMLALGEHLGVEGMECSYGGKCTFSHTFKDDEASRAGYIKLVKGAKVKFLSDENNKGKRSVLKAAKKAGWKGAKEAYEEIKG